MGAYQTAIKAEYDNATSGNNAIDLLLAVQSEAEKWDALKKQNSDANLQDWSESLTAEETAFDEDDSYEIDNQITSFLELVDLGGDLDLVTQRFIELSSSVEAAMARGSLRSKKQQELVERLFSVIKTLQEKIEKIAQTQNQSAKDNIKQLNARLALQVAELGGRLQSLTSKLLESIQKSLELSRKQPQNAANLQLQQSLQNLQQLAMAAVLDMQRMAKELNSMIKDSFDKAKTQNPPNEMLLKALRDLGKLNADNARRLADMTLLLRDNKLPPEKLLKQLKELTSQLKGAEDVMRQARDALMRQQTLLMQSPDKFSQAEASRLAQVNERINSLRAAQLETANMLASKTSLLQQQLTAQQQQNMQNASRQSNIDAASRFSSISSSASVNNGSEISSRQSVVDAARQTESSRQADIGRQADVSRLIETAQKSVETTAANQQLQTTQNQVQQPQTKLENQLSQAMQSAQQQVSQPVTSQVETVQNINQSPVTNSQEIDRRIDSNSQYNNTAIDSAPTITLQTEPSILQSEVEAGKTSAPVVEPQAKEAPAPVIDVAPAIAPTAPEPVITAPAAPAAVQTVEQAINDQIAATAMNSFAVNNAPEPMAAAIPTTQAVGCAACSGGSCCSTTASTANVDTTSAIPSTNDVSADSAAQSASASIDAGAGVDY